MIYLVIGAVIMDSLDTISILWIILVGVWHILEHPKTHILTDVSQGLICDSQILILNITLSWLWNCFEINVEKLCISESRFFDRGTWDISNQMISSLKLEYKFIWFHGALFHYFLKNSIWSSYRHPCSNYCLK